MEGMDLDKLIAIEHLINCAVSECKRTLQYVTLSQFNQYTATDCFHD